MEDIENKEEISVSKISIIIPVYNCSEYLGRCVRSVISQTHRDLQIILVNDGSTDDSGVLCDNFSHEDSRVTVIHQKNAGVSVARNTGLDAATGEFVGFVDADDYIEQDTYRLALACIEDCDIAMWDAVTLWDDGCTEEDTISLLEVSRIIHKADWTPELLAMMAGSACRCLYRAQLVKDVRFPVGIKLSEDRLFNLHAMGKASRLAYLKHGMYIRYVRADSAVHRYHGDKFEKNLLAMKKAEDIICHHWTQDYMDVYTRMFVYLGALAAVYEICSPDFPGKGRLAAIKAITDHQTLKEAFALCPAKGLRERLLQRKANWALLIVGFLFNWKNRLTNK